MRLTLLKNLQCNIYISRMRMVVAWRVGSQNDPPNLAASAATGTDSAGYRTLRARRDSEAPGGNPAGLD